MNSLSSPRGWAGPGIVLALALTALVCSASWGHVDPAADNFTFFAWRSLGYHSNGAPHVKTKVFLGSDGELSTGETGQAEQGWHELHPAPGPQTATFEDRGDAVPTFAGPVVVGSKPEEWAVFDVPIYWPYEVDGLVHSQEFTEMGQTFVAQGDELYTASIRQHTWLRDLYAVVREGGPNNRRVGPPARLVDGPPGDGSRAGWLVARWRPGEMPLEKGKTYYLSIRSAAGKPFALKMHSTGDIYPNGCAYYDGVPEPSSDLGLWLGFQRDDAIQSTVLGIDRDGWVRGVRGVHFIARSANVRGIYADIWFPDTPFHVDVLFRVYRVDADGKMQQVGVDKTGYNFTQPGTAHYLAAIYAADEIPLVVGQKYYIEMTPRDANLPTDPALLPDMDLRVRVWGEKTPGMNPVIYRQHVSNTTQSHVELTWEGSPDVPTTILYGYDPYRLNHRLVVPPGRSTASIGPVAPGTTISLRLRKESPLGGRFDTPIYQVRTLGPDNKPVTEPPLLAPPHHVFLTQCIGFMNLAVTDWMNQPEPPPVTSSRRVSLRNPQFRQKLEGWQAAGSPGVTSINVPGSSDAVGWLVSSEQPKDTHSDSVVYQTVKVRPGKHYRVSARLMTLQEGHSDNWYARHELGDVKARVICDPTGGTTFSGHNSTQWFRTDGQWLTFAKIWKAQSDTMTIGVGFSRIRDLSKVIAAVDSVQLEEVEVAD